MLLKWQPGAVTELSPKLHRLSAMTDTSLLPSGLTPLLNRERAILEFNLRVLAQARRADVPLLERLRYITIVSSNMDEFFEVRFADAIGAMREATDDDDPQRGCARWPPRPMR
jgi:polyphosphate kinase